MGPDAPVVRIGITSIMPTTSIASFAAPRHLAPAALPARRGIIATDPAANAGGAAHLVLALAALAPLRDRTSTEPWATSPLFADTVAAWMDRNGRSRGTRDGFGPAPRRCRSHRSARLEFRRRKPGIDSAIC